MRMPPCSASHSITATAGGGAVYLSPWVVISWFESVSLGLTHESEWQGQYSAAACVRACARQEATSNKHNRIEIEIEIECATNNRSFGCCLLVDHNLRRSINQSSVN